MLYICAMWPFFYSVSNVYKVVQARKGSMLLALAMVILSPFSLSFLNYMKAWWMSYYSLLLSALPFCCARWRSPIVVCLNLLYFFNVVLDTHIGFNMRILVFIWTLLLLQGLSVSIWSNVKLSSFGYIGNWTCIWVSCGKLRDYLLTIICLHSVL